MSELKCKDRVCATLRGRVDDLSQLLAADASGSVDPELGALNEYGLSFDYVAPGSFDGQDEGYFRYQISWGGPSDEFRFFVNPDLSCHRIEYWFLDWFDGASRTLSGESESVLLNLWDVFKDTGALAAAGRHVQL